MIATAASVRNRIQSGRPDPVYLVTGEDEAEKSALVDAFASLVEEELRAFNVERLRGSEVTAADVVSSLRVLPMVAPLRVVIVLHAERLLIPKKDDERSARDL